MQVTCSCGKKLLFGDDPGEVQVCDFCGQTVRADGPVRTEKPSPKRGHPPKPGASMDDDAPPPPRPRKGRPPITTRRDLKIAGARKSHTGLGCLLVLLVGLGAAFAVDYFIVNPVRTLPCGHVGKEAYLFGALRIGHTCPGLEAVNYMRRIRREYPDPSRRPDDIDLIKRQTGIGNPPPPYECEVDGGLMRCYPVDDSGLATFTMDFEGVVTREEDE